MKVSLHHPKKPKVKMFNMGISWGLVAFTVFIFIPAMIVMFQGVGLVIGLISLAFDFTINNKSVVKRLLRKGWTPTTAEDKVMLIRLGISQG